MVETLNRLNILLLSLVWAFGQNFASAGSSVPNVFLRDFESPEFKVRQRAESELLEWGRKKPVESMLEIFTHSQKAEDPEVRERCIAVLRELVGDEYLNAGEGYIGIALWWKDDVVVLPGEDRERKAVRVSGVMPNTPGQLAGIQGNDLIVKLEGDGWKDVDATPQFREKIKSKKPGSLVKMTIFREGKLIDVEVKLSRRPLMADHLQTLDLDAAEAASKEAHFQRWLAQKKLLK